MRKTKAPEWFKDFENRLVSLEEDRKKAPEWFKDFENRLVSLEEDRKKAPHWFVEWSTEFKKENDARWERQEAFNQLLLSLPTIKKEINEMKKSGE